MNSCKMHMMRQAGWTAVPEAEDHSAPCLQSDTNGQKKICSYMQMLLILHAFSADADILS